jgi:hypothetical protein
MTRADVTAVISPPTSTPLEIAMNTATFPGFETLVKPFRFASSPYEYKVTALRECRTLTDLNSLKSICKTLHLLCRSVLPTIHLKIEIRTNH